MLHAIIGIGSNSIRMLVGDLSGGRVTPVQRLREGTRLFAGLQDGKLTGQSIREAASAVARLVQTARREKCETVRIVATSAARDAQNSEELTALVEALSGEPVRILSGEEEARLSFAGAAGCGHAGVVDIGGGSTEICVGGGGRPLTAQSAQLGAVRLLAQKPDLSGDAFQLALDAAKAQLLNKGSFTDKRDRPAAWFGIGGTLTCLASIDMRLPTFDRDAVEGRALRKSAVEGWARKLAAMTVEERAAIPGMFPHRADIIAHGALILLAVMEALDIPSVSVTNRTNLDGCLMEIAEDFSAVDRVQTVQAYYDASVEQEWARLEKNFFEFEINRRYMDRFIKPGDRVLDIGGGPGRYSLHLSGRGADVTLVDLSAKNVEFAQEKAQELGRSLTALQGDARVLEEAVQGEFDAVLLMGPLYHLLTEAERDRAVNAALARLKPGGVLFVAFISMIGAMIYAARSLPESILFESEGLFYEKVIAGEDFAGSAFTQAFFIEPKHLLPYMDKFPLEKLHLVASEGITAPFSTALLPQPPEVTARWLALSLALCEREDFWNYTEHFLYVGRKKGGSL